MSATIVVALILGLLTLLLVHSTAGVGNEDEQGGDELQTTGTAAVAAIDENPHEIAAELQQAMASLIALEVKWKSNLANKDRDSNLRAKAVKKLQEINGELNKLLRELDSEQAMEKAREQKAAEEQKTAEIDKLLQDQRYWTARMVVANNNNRPALRAKAFTELDRIKSDLWTLRGGH